MLTTTKDHTQAIFQEKTRALFVEDDKIDQLALKRSFDSEDPNFSYAIAGSVKEAKQKLGSESFDIVVVDFMLGDGTAFDVLQAVKNIPFIIITGQGSVDVALKALKVGVSDYLIKEPNHSHLLALEDVMKQTLKNYQTEKKVRLLSAAISCVPSSVCVTDMKERILFANPVFKERHGVGEGKLNADWKAKLGVNTDGIMRRVIKNAQGDDEFIVYVE